MKNGSEVHEMNYRTISKSADGSEYLLALYRHRCGCKQRSGIYLWQSV